MGSGIFEMGGRRRREDELERLEDVVQPQDVDEGCLGREPKLLSVAVFACCA